METSSPIIEGQDYLDELRQRDLGAGLWVCIGLYFGAVLLCAAVPFFREKQWKRNEADDNNGPLKHYIAGGALGAFVLPLTLFATLFSGVTLVGMPAEASAQGTYAIRWCMIVIPVAIGFGTLAPRIRRWSDYRGGYLTGVDVVSDRFRSSELRVIVACVQIFATILYVITQLVAIGATVEALSGGAFPRVAAAGSIAVIMLIYESVGGMRSVAWTDVIQGLVLFIGVMFLFVIQTTELGGVPKATEYLESIGYGFMVSPTKLYETGRVVPFLLSFYPFVLYGHLQQRIYAASSERTIKIGVAVITAMGFVIAVAAVLTGLLAKAHFLRIFGVETVEEYITDPDETFGLLMRSLMVGSDNPTQTSANYVLGSFIIAASLASLMSTADSALLSLSSTLCMDIIQPYFWKNISNWHLVMLGRFTSLCAVGLAILVSTSNPDLVGLVFMQQQFLMQLVVIFVAALYFKNARPRPLFFGTFVGIIVSLVMVAYSGPDAVTTGNVIYTSGTAGVLCNIAITVSLHYVDLPFIKNFSQGGSWQRFGEPLPEKMVGYRVPGWASEVIHPPYSYGYIATAFLLFIFGLPWFAEPEVVVTTAGGFPAFAVQQMFLLTFISVFISWLINVGWGTDHAEEIVPAAVSMAKDFEKVIDDEDSGERASSSENHTEESHPKVNDKVEVDVSPSGSSKSDASDKSISQDVELVENSTNGLSGTTKDAVAA